MASSARASSPPGIRPFQPPTAALLVYPATLIVGSLFSVLSPTAQGSRASAYGDPTTMTPTAGADAPVNYFARKNNIFNVYFVKIGWLWTTLAFTAILLGHSTYTAPSSQRPRRTGQALLRYALATLAWWLTTQWFFGPAIIDRSFVLTGGRCERVAPLAGDAGDGDDSPGLRTLFSAAACKAAGGAWHGGHDVSGHVFMLVLATAVLVFELGGVLGGADAGKGSEVGVGSWSRRFVVAVVGLSWWMLLMTAIWFHTWLEKLNGLLIALGTVYMVYILPRRVTPWRNVVGVPGV
ncbi:inositol phospholipid synthesis and fat-storage-inducing TM-domain-containing protein [Aspergillus ambiguus]|uniref:putative inositol phospholipid biosynthesis protein Scs3 n=1 Tax=Aspergillus ambiguus TaxID=176160 RepID=UPI003CCDBAC4